MVDASDGWNDARESEVREGRGFECWVIRKYVENGGFDGEDDEQEEIRKSRWRKRGRRSGR
jgi:hypothetical protein